MNVHFCTKSALTLGQAPNELIEKLLPFSLDDFSCHECSMLLVQRCTSEMMKAAHNGQWDLAAVKLMSLVMLLKLGFLDVFKENLTFDGLDVRCNKVDYERFSRCCKLNN